MYRENESNYGPLFGHHVPESKEKKPLINNPNMGLLSELIDELYSEAYRRGDFSSLNGMAEIRKRGEIKTSPRTIFGMFRKASEHGCMDAQYNLRICYLKGFGTKRCVQEAIYALSKAASQYDLRFLKVLNRLQMDEQGPSEDLKAKLIIAERCDDMESIEPLWKVESDKDPPEDITK